MSLSYEQALETLRESGQLHLLDHWGSLRARERSSLLEQVESIDSALLQELKKALSGRDTAGDIGAMEPCEVVRKDSFDRDNARAKGENMLGNGKIGVLLVAGGQGSRLGFDGPKGAFPIGPISSCTLFEIHARKILALERKYSAHVPFYIMTSRENDAPTREFFEKHDYFGLSKDRVVFFKQGMWPAMWPDGRLVLDRPDHIFMSPNGHGGMIEAMVECGVMDDIRSRKLDHLFYFQVDNPLVEVADPVFLGLHESSVSDMSVKVCAKRDPNEGLGVVVTRGGSVSIVEYSELTEQQKQARNKDGTLQFGFGSVAIHVFSTDFLSRTARTPLPLHVAHKKVPYWTPEEGAAQPASPNAYKFERFIFDLLPCARNTLVLEFDRSEEFSPVKNASGSDSADTAGSDISRKFAKWLERCGIVVPRENDGSPSVKIEIDPCFAISPNDLAGRISSGMTVENDLLLK